MIEKVLFDLGNVLLRFDFGRAHAGMAAYGARFDNLDEEALTALKEEYETGLIDNDAMFQRLSALTGYNGSQDHFERSWQNIFEENQPMIEVLMDLRERGIPCYLLSNSNDLHVRYISERYDVLSAFTGTIFSHEAKMMKPGEAIYEKAIAQFSLDPGKTVYIDDLPHNIATGRRMGFHCLHYDPDAHEEAETEMKALGLIPV